MNGITEYTVSDIYDYIHKHEERAFALKFAAMEIYNEVVRDLLSTDSSPLRLLDDPEKGTVIERLTEETLTDWSHLKELLSICEGGWNVLWVWIWFFTHYRSSDHCCFTSILYWLSFPPADSGLSSKEALMANEALMGSFTSATAGDEYPVDGLMSSQGLVRRECLTTNGTLVQKFAAGSERLVNTPTTIAAGSEFPVTALMSSQRLVRDERLITNGTLVQKLAAGAYGIISVAASKHNKTNSQVFFLSRVSKIVAMLSFRSFGAVL